jgi:sec1 family domain-containing protein 1
MVAMRLDRKLRDHILNSKDNLFSGSRAGGGSTASSRPVLVLLDRNVDLTAMLSHSWTYQSLVHDVLNMKLNKITVETPIDENNPAKGKSKKVYDLSASDFFWTKHAGAPVVEAADSVDNELQKWREESTAMTKKAGASNFEDLQSETSAAAQHLKAVIGELPEMQERKATLDMHMNILTAIFNGIKNRQVDSFFQIEEEIMKQTKEQIMEVIKGESRGNDPVDKLRLFIIWFLSVEQQLSRGEVESFQKALEAAGADVSSLPYIVQ